MRSGLAGLLVLGVRDDHLRRDSLVDDAMITCMVTCQRMKTNYESMNYEDDKGLMFGSIVCTIMAILSLVVLGIILAWAVL